MVNGFGYALIVGGILIVVILLIKFFTRNNSMTLDSKINGVRSKWDKVCEKIKHMVGC